MTSNLQNHIWRIFFNSNFVISTTFPKVVIEEKAGAACGEERQGGGLKRLFLELDIFVHLNELFRCALTLFKKFCCLVDSWKNQKQSCVLLRNAKNTFSNPIHLVRDCCPFNGTQEWKFFCLRFWILCYFLYLCSNIKILKKSFFDQATIGGDTIIPLSLRLSRIKFSLVWEYSKNI